MSLETITCRVEERKQVGKKDTEAEIPLSIICEKTHSRQKEPRLNSGNT